MGIPAFHTIVLATIIKKGVVLVVS